MTRHGGSVPEVEPWDRNMPVFNDETRYQILKLLIDSPDINQRDLAKTLGISLGKTNYCLNALIDKGLVKASSFKHNLNKKAYAYLLTPKGIEEKARITLRFLKHKQQEYNLLIKELEELRFEAAQLKPAEEWD
jgi:EPS-associated MarR family transcriptional regulator